MKVSIITATHNRAHLIAETIKSVLAQSYTNFEYLIIDDASTDNTEEIVRQFNDARIKYFKHSKTINLSPLHNFAIEKSDGELIAILDSDDLWVPHKLERVIQVFSTHKEISLVTHNLKYFRDGGPPDNSYYKIQKDISGDLFNEVLLFRLLPFSVFSFKRSILKETEYMNEKYFDGQQDFLFRVSKKYKIYLLSEALAYIRLHNSNTHNMVKDTRSYTDYYKATFSLFIKREIGAVLFCQSMLLISKNLILRLTGNTEKF